MDAVWYEDLRGQLFSLLIAVEDRLGREQARWVHHVIDAGEYGLALEDMAGILAQAKAPVTDQERASMLGLARRMQMDDLVPRVVQCCRRTGRPAPPAMAAPPGADGAEWQPGTAGPGSGPPGHGQQLLRRLYQELTYLAGGHWLSSQHWRYFGYCGGHLPAAEVIADDAAPARSALIMRARALSAAFEPVMPPLRNARRDTGRPAAASLRATIRACSTCACTGRGPSPVIPWPCCDPGARPAWSRLTDRSRPACSLLRPGPAWSCGDQDKDRGTAGGPVRLPGAYTASASARSMWASAVPMPRTRTGRHDTTVVIAHGARPIPAWAIRW
jgi:hypothetical protein